jgi:phosphohistidine phosphatase
MDALVVIRHAKAAWPEGVADIDRPLAERGVRDAPVIGEWVRANVQGPLLALVSPALRTRQTWEAMAASVPDARMRIEPELYDAPWPRMLRVARSAAPEVGSLILVSHNPGSQDLVAALSTATDKGGKRRLRALEKFPTSAVAVLTPRAQGDWLVEDGARLTEFEVCRG